MKTLVIPVSFFNAYYDSSKYPGSPACKGIEHGANCQYFAYEMLRHFGMKIPDLRSRELWDDTAHTKKIKKLQPLDILFFNKNKESYGAHVGIYLGNEKVIHLSKEVGYPTVWSLADFKKRDKYKKFIGAKRALSK